MTKHGGKTAVKALTCPLKTAANRSEIALKERFDRLQQLALSNTTLNNRKVLNALLFELRH